MTPLDALRRYFGYTAFREHQGDIIDTVLAGGDAFVLMPTGSGKSVCYQIPAIVGDGVGIVVSPLIALMEDQVEGLRQNGVAAEVLNSTLSADEAAAVRRRAERGRVDLLYVAPERLVTAEFQAFLARIRPCLFAIDEAHCVSQWGHDFRPEYLRINEVTARFPDCPRMALTATADAVTRKDILEKLSLERAVRFVSSFDRPNIRYRVGIKAGDRRQLLDFIRREHSRDAGIVYVRTRNRAESTADWLAANGVDALAYHAGLSADRRLDHQRRFQDNRTRVIVATIAFGMGIDKPDVRFVAHLDLPASMEAYYQETGRAGRDGEPADAWMLYSLADVAAMRRLFEMSEGGDGHKAVLGRKLDALLGYCESTACRRVQLLRYFGEEREEACGNCDNCLTPARTWDGTVAAQKALSCVYRTGQRFGAQHLVDVLLGNPTPRVARWGHDRIPTFGVGRELDRKAWGSVFRQLLSAGLLSVDLGRKAGFRLTAESRAVLTGKRRVRLREDGATGKPGPRRRPRGVGEADPGDPEVLALFDRLRELRRDAAAFLGVPPYVVFHDATLREMAGARPSSPAELLAISGVGEAKAARYGALFLAALRGEAPEVSRYLDRPPGGEKDAGEGP